ncbi:hypothetical protein IB233_03120 [Comamonas sp. CMM01]|uniref:hypothetical protein n=1 Tax=Comamonas sp. CMM01 TaxID=2769280 RepID=UPI001786B4CF|nr:hypothetical protein [Comamonas sp. CMM01]MBD9530624.1 hypothetical protein [Comamonas sp. CMM01]
MSQRLLACLVLAIAATGCSKSTPDAASATQPSEAPRTVAQLDEAGLIAAVGSPAVYEYPLDDGRGLNFRAKDCTPQDCQPAFKLEFRKGRINLSWEQISGDAKLEAMNAQNVQWADQVLTYALGKEAAVKVMLASTGDQPLKFQHLGHEVRMLAPRKSMHSVLVTIAPIP